MKSRILLTLLSVVAVGFTAVAADDDTPLSKEMKDMNRSLRTLKRQLADASKKDDNVALVEKVKKNIANTKDLAPKKTADQADKAGYTKKFHDEMADLDKSVDELEAAVKAGNADDAKKALDKMYKEKEKGHKDFGVDDD